MSNPCNTHWKHSSNQPGCAQRSLGPGSRGPSQQGGELAAPDTGLKPVKDHSQILLRELREYMWKLKQKPQTSINANWTGFKNWSWFQIGYVESRVVPSAGFNLKDLAVPTW